MSKTVIYFLLFICLSASTGVSLAAEEATQTTAPARFWHMGLVVSGPVVLPEFGNHHYVFLNDPEGNLLELFQASADKPAPGLQQ